MTDKTIEMIPMGVSARNKGREISRKHGDTLIGTLRASYGSRFAFAKGCTDNEKLSDALAKLDEPSLFKDRISTSSIGVLRTSSIRCPPAARAAKAATGLAE
jgi:hypothetical protein